MYKTFTQEWTHSLQFLLSLLRQRIFHLDAVESKFILFCHDYYKLSCYLPFVWARPFPPPNTAGVRDSFIIGFCNSLVKKHREPLSTFSERLILLNHSSNISQNTTKIPVQNLENSLIFCNFAPKLMI